MDKKCPLCGELTSRTLCLKCVQEIAGIINDKRNAIINDAMQSLDREADEVFAQDPTKGRGRGPKWMNIDISDT